MSDRPDVTIVVVNYNTRDYTAQCLDSIFASPPRASFEIVVVDNASSDGSAGWLEARYPQVTLIRSPENRGIAGGNNLGIRAGTGRYVLLLNNDTLVLSGMLDRVVAFLDGHPKAGGVGGRLVNADGSFQSGFVDFPCLWQGFLIFTRLGQLVKPYYPSHPPDGQVREVDWMSTAFMLFRRDALEKVGLVDEEFFIYSDETDLQYRLKQVGWQIYYLPDVRTVHFGGKSLTPWRRRKMVYRGYLLFFHKHYARWQAVALRLLFASLSAVKLPIWAMAYLPPGSRSRARHELKSNLEILAMCLHRGVVAPG